MAFDDADGRPLYRLLLGVAGRSRGIETARRCGLEQAVVARARELLGEDAFELDEILARLERAHLAVEEERKAIAARREALEMEIAGYRKKRGEYELTRRQAQRRALREANDVLESARAEVERVVEQIRRRGADRESIRAARAALRAKLESVRERIDAAPADVEPLAHVSVGDRVAISPAGDPAGEVVEVSGNRALLEINGRRITLPAGRLYPASSAAPEPGGSSGPGGTDDDGASAGTVPGVEFEPLTSLELDIRGHDRESALAALIRFVDRAALTGVHEIKIIHGTGTGVLSAAVREYLRGDARVEWFREGERAEGGAGVTVVRFSR